MSVSEARPIEPRGDAGVPLPGAGLSARAADLRDRRPAPGMGLGGGDGGRGMGVEVGVVSGLVRECVWCSGAVVRVRGV